MRPNFDEGLDMTWPDMIGRKIACWGVSTNKVIKRATEPLAKCQAGGGI
jgi:hypothetical protein